MSSHECGTELEFSERHIRFREQSLQHLMLPLPGVMDPWRVGDTSDLPARSPLQRRQVRLSSYTRKKAHRKERQGQEASGSQNWMAVWENHVFCYDPQKFQHDSTAAQFSTFRSMALQMVRYIAFEQILQISLAYLVIYGLSNLNDPCMFFCFLPITRNSRYIKHEGH